MTGKTIGAILGVAALLLWFMPLVHLHLGGDFEEMMPGGVNLVQSGQNIGGMAYLMLAAAVAIAYFSWSASRIPLLIAAGLGLLVAILLGFQAGANMAWGLIGLISVFSASGALALTMPKETAT